MSDQNAVVTSCCTGIVQLAYIVAYSIALARGDSPDNVTNYLIGMLVAAILSFLAICQIWFGSVSGILCIVFFILGWIWFDQLNGMNIVRFYQTFGANEWLNFPLGTRILYFNLWATIFAFALLGLVLIIFLLSCAFAGVSESFSNRSYKSDTFSKNWRISFSKPRKSQQSDVELGRSSQSTFVVAK
ncbi:hypothetical protein HDU83_008191 [Entophlyctis luteolus]|nr:hypothetical protein HDU83_008191 [Entophlyctis luteolus]KAJ3385487.1 hypothetical protein HDU84_002237 [Entophlyctis sp. JEL0112]